MEYQKVYQEELELCSEELCANEDIGALSYDDTQYTPLEVFVEAVKSKIGSKGKFKPKRYIPIKRLRVNGKVKSEPMEDYLATDAISSSLMKQALVSPRHYYIAKHTPIAPKNTKHFELGTFAHSAILEPCKFRKLIAEPVVNLATKEGVIALVNFFRGFVGTESLGESCENFKMAELKGKLAELKEELTSMGYTFIDGYNAQLTNIMRQSYETYAGGVFIGLMKYAKKEISMYGVDPSTGLDVKIRPDAILLEEDFGMNVIISVKTTSATTPEAFQRDCAKYRYEVSEGMYLDVASHITGRHFSGTLMIVMQTTAPYQMFALWWDAEDLQIGKYKYYNAMQTIKECSESGVYKGFDSLAEEGCFGIIKGSLPSYIKRELPPQYVTE